MYILKTSILCDVTDKKLKYLASTTNTSPIDKNTRSESHPESVKKQPKSLEEFVSRPAKKQKKKALTRGGNKSLSRPVTGKGAGTKGNADSFEAARDKHSASRRGRERGARGVSGPRSAFVPAGRCRPAVGPV